ncbi:MAG: hypothetical protein E5Y89_15455 [Mesorhizobium sp.]|nr:MAG: hypothetical protein E5Y89_15455 [Mesorhizobium sp.]
MPPFVLSGLPHIRLNHRLTAADKEVDQRLLELHAGELPPRTRLSIERPTGATRRRGQSGSFLFRR